MARGIVEYVEQSGIREVVIVSPHLDDAAFSASGLLLSRVSQRCRVVTVFTQANAHSDRAWALAGGFADPVQEHAARRREDRDAMAHIGVDFLHLGFGPGEFTPEEAAGLAKRIASPDGRAAVQAAPDRILCLLPAGAGLSGRPGNCMSRWRALTGQHRGATAHPEHLAVRDRLLQSLESGGCRVGFYGEFPYLWRDWTRRMRGRLETLSGRPVRRYTARPDPESKLRLVEVYASQVALNFDATREGRIRAIDRNEEYFVANADK